LRGLIFIGDLPTKESWKRYMIMFLALVFMAGCAPLPDLEEEEGTETEAVQTLSKAELDELIGKYRSFAHEDWKKGKYEEAKQYYDSVLTYDYDHKINVYRALADCCINLKDHEGAIHNYETGIKYFPDDDYLRSSLALVYKGMGRIEESIEQQLEAIRIKPENIDFKMSLAELYVKAEDFDGAIKTYQELMEMLPDDESIRKKYELLVMTQRDPEEFLQTLREGVEAFPADVARRLSYANALLDQGLNKEAVAEYRKYSEQVPDDAKGWNGQAKANDNLENTQAAIAAYKKVVNLEPKNSIAMVAIGEDYLTMKNWNKVRIWSKKALSADPKAGSAWVLLGDAYQESADISSGEKTPSYNDKLVFLIAYGLYKKASTSQDIDAASDGERGMHYLKASELIPAKEDWFMNKGKIFPVGSQYKWIDKSWAETKYIEKYLESLGG